MLKFMQLPSITNLCCNIVLFLSVPGSKVTHHHRSSPFQYPIKYQTHEGLFTCLFKVTCSLHGFYIYRLKPGRFETLRSSSYHYITMSKMVNCITCRSDTTVSESPKLLMTAQYLCGERRARRIDGHFLPKTVLQKSSKCSKALSTGYFLLAKTD